MQLDTLFFKQFPLTDIPDSTNSELGLTQVRRRLNRKKLTEFDTEEMGRMNQALEHLESRYLKVIHRSGGE